MLNSFGGNLLRRNKTTEKVCCPFQTWKEDEHALFIDMRNNSASALNVLMTAAPS
jgi:hypothetical protein